MKNDKLHCPRLKKIILRKRKNTLRNKLGKKNTPNDINIRISIMRENLVLATYFKKKQFLKCV